MKKLTEEVIRVRFLREGKAPSRPKRIRKVTFEILDKKGKRTEICKYFSMQAPLTRNARYSIKGKVIREGLKILFHDINPKLFITDWERGETPTPKPLRRYNDEKLKEMGYSIAAISDIRGRTYRAKDVAFLHTKLKGTVDNRKIRKLLDDADGSLIKAMELAKEYIKNIPKTKKTKRKEYMKRRKEKKLSKSIELPVVDADTNLKQAA